MSGLPGGGARVHLSRRNLLTLLSKLDRVRAGGTSARQLNKYDAAHPVYPQSHACVQVIAVEDAEYYRDRSPGPVDSRDEP